MLFNLSKNDCKCGKKHIFDSQIFIGEGVVDKLIQPLAKWCAKKVFIYADVNTFSVAGEKIVELLNKANIHYKKFVFDKQHLEPDEYSVGLAMMNFDTDADAIIGIGSGVINDICKIVSNLTNKKYIIVATAPSMDGFASATSSMTKEGLKVSLESRCADIIVGDTDFLCTAPTKMLLSGLGDMLAKYISICEWRISNIINGEYYCEEIAQLVRSAVNECIDNVEGLVRREKNAVQSVFEGLIICGAAMKFAGLSRPASGIEHYMSHIWDMRGIEFGTKVDSHGIQCAVATLISVELYEKIVVTVPDKKKALDFVAAFDFEAWSEELKSFLGKGSKSMILLEETDKKYDKEKHSERLETIVNNWDSIRNIIQEEIPPLSELLKLYDRAGLPKTLGEIGIDDEILPMTFKSSKDIRDKYVLSRLCWDLGIIDEII